MLFSIFDVLRVFEALQIFFYKFLLKWGKSKDCESNIFFEAQKYFFVFHLRLNFLFQMVICPTLLNSTAFSTLLGVVNYNVDVHNVVNVDLTLCDVATSYQPKNNVEPTLKCLLGSNIKTRRKNN